MLFIKSKCQIGIGEITIIVVAMLALSVIPLNKAFSQDSQTLSPLDEAAIKHSPGNLISNELKGSKQFLLLNELLLVDELILKQAKLLNRAKELPKEECGEIPEELYCLQIQVIILQKKRIVPDLEKATNQTDFSSFKDIDLLIELEIVDDLLIVQADLRKVLYELIKKCSNVDTCNGDKNCSHTTISETRLILEEQAKVIIKKKKKILEALKKRFITP